jgi:hypothetical protein
MAIHGFTCAMFSEIDEFAYGITLLAKKRSIRGKSDKAFAHCNVPAISPHNSPGFLRHFQRSLSMRARRRYSRHRGTSKTINATSDLYLLAPMNSQWFAV